MIGYLKGVVTDVKADTVLIEVNGIGYLVQMPISQLDSLPGPGEEFMVYTHLIQRDDSVSLYGFVDDKGLDIFRMLLEVSGVGPRLALNILSVVPVDELIRSISAGDSVRLQAVHGVGKKTAARICVDLKEKAVKYLRQSGLEPAWPRKDSSLSMDEARAGMVEDAISALSNLGYRPSQARKAVMKVLEGQGADNENHKTVKDINLLIKSALQLLSRIGTK